MLVAFKRVRLRLTDIKRWLGSPEVFQNHQYSAKINRICGLVNRKDFMGSCQRNPVPGSYVLLLLLMVFLIIAVPFKLKKKKVSHMYYCKCNLTTLQ